MANEGPDTNGSQFFITLGDTPELQGKNTLFGRVEGDTIYNVAKMGEAEVGENDRPVYPTRVTSVEVLVNPFKDMVKRVRTAPVVQQQKPVEKKKKRKAGKQLLSFGADEGDGEDLQPVVKKAKFDTRIVMDTQDAAPEPKPKQASGEAKKKVANPISVESSPEPSPEPAKSLPNRAAKPDIRDISSSPEPEPVQKVSSLLDRTNAQIAELKASMKRNVQTAPVKEKKKSVLETMIPRTSVRGRKRHPGESAPPDPRTLDILNAFKSKLDQAPPEKDVPKLEPILAEEKKDQAEDDEEAALCDLHFIANCQSCQKWDAQGEGENEDDDDDIGWMSHALSFKEDKLGKDLSYRKKAEDELVVIDPREKARTLKEEKRAQREAKAGGSGRAWDQARNEKLARSSALAGRGAK
jgi:peptidyl-prolyl cis-trans isomerase SDCCAG10